MNPNLGSTAHYLANEPDVAAASATRRLVAYLAACGHANGNLGVQDSFTFTDQDGSPDLVAARRFAEGIRNLYRHEELGHRIGVRQTYNRVVVRLIPTGEVDAVDAVATTPALTC